MKSSGVKEMVTNIILVILAIAFIVLGGVFLNEMHYATNVYTRDANSFIYNIQSNLYSNMVSEVYSNRNKGVKETAELKEVYGVADYFHAASIYKAYVADGNRVKSKLYQDKMDAAEKNMGDFSYVSDDIDSMLSLK